MYHPVYDVRFYIIIKGRVRSKLLFFFVTYLPELAADPNKENMQY